MQIIWCDFLVGVSELDEQAGVRHEFAGAV